MYVHVTGQNRPPGVALGQFAAVAAAEGIGRPPTLARGGIGDDLLPAEASAWAYPSDLRRSSMAVSTGITPAIPDRVPSRAVIVRPRYISPPHSA